MNTFHRWIGWIMLLAFAMLAGCGGDDSGTGSPFQARMPLDDLVGVAVHHQRRDGDLLQVFGEVGLRQRDDRVVVAFAPGQSKPWNGPVGRSKYNCARRVATCDDDDTDQRPAR